MAPFDESLTRDTCHAHVMAVLGGWPRLQRADRVGAQPGLALTHDGGRGERLDVCEPLLVHGLLDVHA